MAKITTFKQADDAVKKLLPHHDGQVVTVSKRPKIYDSKRFWPVLYFESATNEPITIIGYFEYLADNGKLIYLPSNLDIFPYEQHEAMLLSEYDA